MTIITGRLITAVVPLMLLLAWNATYAQSPLMSELYYTSLTSPKETDQFIEENKHRFDNKFFSCLKGLRIQAAIGAGEHGNICNAYPTPQDQKCRLENWPLAIFYWTVSIEEVLKGGKTWEETKVGTEVYRNEKVLDWYETITPGVRILVNNIVEAQSQSLICK